jgi:hypothetical protein
MALYPPPPKSTSLRKVNEGQVPTWAPTVSTNAPEVDSECTPTDDPKAGSNCAPMDAPEVGSNCAATDAPEVGSKGRMQADSVGVARKCSMLAVQTARCSSNRPAGY